jgi:hypothetical protein
MAWFAAAAPLISTGASTAIALAQMQNARATSKFNAELEANQGKEAQMQAARDEEQQRRESAQFLGRQRAALAQSGASAGGTAGLLLDQSAVLAELDALNIRYGGNLRGAGLLYQAGATRRQGRSDAAGYGLLAGGRALTGAGQAYARGG